MKFPISQLVTDSDVELQESAASALARMVLPSDRISTEVTKEGLVLHAVSELDLEIATDSLRAVSRRQLFPGKPRINYIDDGVWKEPYASLVVTIPSGCLIEVLADLQSRRAEMRESGLTAQRRRSFVQQCQWPNSSATRQRFAP